MEVLARLLVFIANLCGHRADDSISLTGNGTAARIDRVRLIPGVVHATGRPAGCRMKEVAVLHTVRGFRGGNGVVLDQDGEVGRQLVGSRICLVLYAGCGKFAEFPFARYCTIPLYSAEAEEADSDQDEEQARVGNALECQECSFLLRAVLAQELPHSCDADFRFLQCECSTFHNHSLPFYQFLMTNLLFANLHEYHTGEKMLRILVFC